MAGQGGSPAPCLALPWGTREEGQLWERARPGLTLKPIAHLCQAVVCTPRSGEGQWCAPRDLGEGRTGPAGTILSPKA